MRRELPVSTDRYHSNPHTQDKQQGLVGAMKEAASPPEGVPRLFDLVKPQHPDLLPAFYFALRNTVVAKDLDQVSGPHPNPSNLFTSLFSLFNPLTHIP